MDMLGCTRKPHLVVHGSDIKPRRDSDFTAFTIPKRKDAAIAIKIIPPVTLRRAPHSGCTL